MGKQSIYEEFLRNKKRYPRIPYSFMNDSVDGKGEFFAFALGKRVKSQDRLPQFYSAMTHLLNPNIEVCEGVLKFDIPVVYWIEPLLIHWRQFVDQLSDEMKEFLCDRLTVLMETASITEEFRMTLMLLVFFNNDLTQRKIQYFEKHSAYTFYIVFAKSYCIHENEWRNYLKRLEPSLSGYARLYYLFFYPIRTKADAVFLLNVMMKQVSMRSIAAKSCMYHPQLLRVIMAHEMTPDVERNYQLCLLHGTTDELFIRWMIDSIYPLSFLTKKNRVLTIEEVALLYRMKECLTLELTTCDEVDSEAFHQFHYLKGLVDKVIWSIQTKVEALIKSALKSTERDDALIIFVLNQTNVKLGFSKFSQLLAKDPLSLTALGLIEKSTSKTFIEEAIEYIKEIVRPEVYDYMKDHSTLVLPPQFFALSKWHEVLLNKMIQFHLMDYDYIWQVLHFPDHIVRVKVIELLKSLNLLNKKEVRLFLYPVYKDEMDRELKNEFEKIVWQR